MSSLDILREPSITDIADSFIGSGLLADGAIVMHKGNGRWPISGRDFGRWRDSNAQGKWPMADIGSGLWPMARY